MCIPIYHAVVVQVLVESSSISSDSVKLACLMYGYPRNSLQPVWTHGLDTVLNDSRYTITMSNVNLLSGNSVRSTDMVMSYLTVNDTTEENSGEYTCTVQGNSSTVIINSLSAGRTKHAQIPYPFKFLTLSLSLY